MPASLAGCFFLLVPYSVGITAAHAQQPAPNAPLPGRRSAPLLAGDPVASSNKDDREASALAEQLAMLSKEEAGSSSGSATTNDAGPAGIVPFTPGLNASLGTAGQHDSSGGWQSILTPNVAFRFNRYFSANLTVPVYAYIGLYGVLSSKDATKNKPAVATYGYKTQEFLLGDTDLVGEFEAHPRPFDYNLTATLGIPSGSDDAGLGAGQVTYAINNNFEHALADWLGSGIGAGPWR